jgi:hypothetical protein
MAAGFAVAVRLVDLATGPIANINKAIGGLEKSATRIGRNTGFFQARDALKSVRKEAAEAGERHVVTGNLAVIIFIVALAVRCLPLLWLWPMFITQITRQTKNVSRSV